MSEAGAAVSQQQFQFISGDQLKSASLIAAAGQTPAASLGAALSRTGANQQQQQQQRHYPHQLQDGNFRRAGSQPPLSTASAQSQQAAAADTRRGFLMGPTVATASTNQLQVSHQNTINSTTTGTISSSSSVSKMRAPLAPSG